MARRKLTEEEKLEIKRLENEKRLENNLNTRLKDYIKKKHLYANPTRTFKVGDYWFTKGGYKEFEEHHKEIVEVYEEGLFYKIKRWGIGQSYGNPSPYKDDYMIVSWLDLFNKENIREEKFKKKERRRLQYYQTDMTSLINKHYYFGINYNPDYQRDLVWSLEDKISLLDSIFNNVDIGKFVFVRLPYDDSYADNYLYEVMDGKQRINTIIEYYEDRFPYNGVYFSQLNWLDKNQILNYPVSVAEVEDMTEAEKIELFLAINTTGKVVSKKHLEEIKKKYLKGEF